MEQKYSLAIKLAIAAVAAGVAIYFGMDPTSWISSYLGGTTILPSGVDIPHSMIGLFS